MKQLILDTNFLMAVGQFKIDIFSELRRICNFDYRLFIIDKTVDELKKIMEQQKGSNKLAAKMALEIIKDKRIKKIKTEEGYVDQLIIETADKDAIVATQDLNLKRRLKKKAIPIVVIRQKKYLVLV